MEWLLPQIMKGVVRTRVGKSAFSDGSTIRFILRDELPQPMMDSDIKCAYGTFRYLRLLAAMKAKFPRLCEFVGGIGVELLVVCLAPCVTPPPSADLVKSLLIGAMNLGEFQGWLYAYKLQANLDLMIDKTAWTWYQEISQEIRAYVAW